MSRVRLLQWLLALGGVVVWLRLYELQWRQHGYWKKRGEQIRIWEEQLPARRGRLLDRRGREIADNEPWVEGRPLTPERQARLAEGGRDYAISAQRSYPQGSLCGHLVGYVGDGNVGRDGLERSLDRKLRGRDGQRRWLVTAQGGKLRLLGERPAEAGSDVVLSLDLDLQRTAREALFSVLEQLGSARAADDQPAGAVVVMRTDTGQVLSLVSLPDFDPNWFVQPGHSRQVNALLRAPSAPLLNRAVAAQVPAASTFKIVTATAALKYGLITPQRRFYCPGRRLIGGVPFHCFVRSGHGDLSFEDSLSVSCDCVFYDLGLELGGKRLAEWAGHWGLGRESGLNLPGEQAGLVPVMEDATAGQEANLSIGQGDLLVTPLQMARVVAAVPNHGRLPRPTLLERARPAWDPGVSLEEESWARLEAGLAGTVEHGTAAGAGAQGLGLAGKTGTVENSPSATNPRGYNHTWFVGYSSADRLAICVYLERSGGYGGGLAAPVAREILKSWRALQEK